jgi:hypothetical protein
MQKAMRISRYLRKYKNKDKIILIFKILFVPLQSNKNKYKQYGTEHHIHHRNQGKAKCYRKP